MWTRNSALAVCAAILSIAVETPAFGRATFVEFDAPGAGMGLGEGTTALTIDKVGDVAGIYEGGNGPGGFIRTKDGAFVSFSRSIETLVGANSRGETVGSYINENKRKTFGFWATPEGKISRINVKGSGLFGTQPSAINAKDEIAGSFGYDDGAMHGFFRARAGKIVTFDAPGAGTGLFLGTYPKSMNDNAFMTGFYVDNDVVFHGFVSRRGASVTTFDIASAGTQRNLGTFPSCIDAQNTIVGSYSDSGSVRHGFARTEDGSVTIFDVPKAGNGAGQGTFVSCINRTGTIAGQFIDSNGVSHGYVRSSAGKLVAFDAPGAGTDTEQGTMPQNINDRGQIVGCYVDSVGAFHGFIRTP